MNRATLARVDLAAAARPAPGSRRKLPDLDGPLLPVAWHAPCIPPAHQRGNETCTGAIPMKTKTRINAGIIRKPLKRARLVLRS
jgi:hypothetical protein